MNPLTDIEHELRLAAEWALLRCQRAEIDHKDISKALWTVWDALGVRVTPETFSGWTRPRGSNGFMEVKPL